MYTNRVKRHKVSDYCAYHILLYITLAALSLLHRLKADADIFLHFRPHISFISAGVKHVDIALGKEALVTHSRGHYTLLFHHTNSLFPFLL